MSRSPFDDLIDAATAPSAEPPAQAATDARPEDYFPELVPGDKTLALVGALGRLADYFSPQSGSADAHAIRCKCSKCEWADDIREAGRVLEQQAREIAKLRADKDAYHYERAARAKVKP